MFSVYIYNIMGALIFLIIIFPLTGLMVTGIVNLFLPEMNKTKRIILLVLVFLTVLIAILVFFNNAITMPQFG